MSDYIPEGAPKPCLRCLETLQGWAEQLGLSEDAPTQLVEQNPVKPHKNWIWKGRGDHLNLSSIYCCPRCGASFRGNMRL